MTALQLGLDGVCELAPDKYRKSHQRREVGDQPDRRSHGSRI